MIRSLSHVTKRISMSRAATLLMIVLYYYVQCRMSSQSFYSVYSGMGVIGCDTIDRHERLAEAIPERPAEWGERSLLLLSIVIQKIEGQWRRRPSRFFSQSRVLPSCRHFRMKLVASPPSHHHHQCFPRHRRRLRHRSSNHPPHRCCSRHRSSSEHRMPCMTVAP